MRQQQVWPSTLLMKVPLPTVMERLWLQRTVVTVDIMRGTDEFRIAKVEAVTASMKHRRKSLSTEKTLKRHKQEMDEGSTYGAGMEN